MLSQLPSPLLPGPNGPRATPEQSPVPQDWARCPRQSLALGGGGRDTHKPSRWHPDRPWRWLRWLEGDAGAQSLRDGPSGLSLTGWMGLDPPGWWGFGDRGVTGMEQSGSRGSLGMAPSRFLGYCLL